jgi:hypothetical protein
MANDMTWFKGIGFKPQAPTLPSVPSDEEECTTFESVASGPCGWLLAFSLSYEGMRGFINNNKW